jgi:uroporphyrinogen-III synthase
MTRPILTVRPEPGCSATIAAGAELGLAIEGCPLLELRPVDWQMPQGRFDGLLLGSANALRFGGQAVDKLADKPVYAVGKATAEAARQRGFNVAAVGEGGLQKLLETLGGAHLRLLRLAGRERVALDPPPGIVIETAITYESSALPLSADAAAILRAGALVLLHSGTAARQLAAECDRLAVHRGEIALAALAPRIEEAAGAGWAARRSADQPTEAALLALAREMCHEPPRD